MSEKLPESQPVLVPRKGGKIEVWHETGMIDKQGNRQVISQVPEEFEGRMDLVEKYVKKELFDPRIQNALANDLGMDRNPTAEELDRHIQPVLSRRKDGRIEVWNKTGKVNENGSFQIMSQVPEKIDGKTDLASMSATKELFDPRVQAAFAHELGMDRNPTTAELDRHFKTDKDLGEVSLSAVEIQSPDAANKPTNIDHLNNLNSSRMETPAVLKEREVRSLADLIIGMRGLAAKGKITSFDGKTTHSPDDLDRIFDKFVDKSKEGTIGTANLLRLIPRSDGLRDAVEQALKSGIDTVEQAVAASRVESSAQSEVIAEAPSVEIQAEAEDPLAEITKGLSEKDIKHLQGYASALEQKNRAQQSGNGDGSTLWGRIAGEHMKDLTPKALEIVYRYADIYSRI